jgi:hypothetical protein
MRKIFFTLLLCAGTATAASAQVRMGLYGLADFPLNDFHNTGYYNGGGFGMSFMSGALNTTTANPNPLVKLHVGGNFDFNSFGSKHYDNIILNGGDNRKAMVDVSDNSIGLNLAARLIFTDYKFRPYFEGFAGLRTFGTDETISPVVTSPDYENQTSNDIITRGTFAYGLSAGMLWKLKDGLDLETGVIYSRGTFANYQLMDKIQQVGNEIHYGFDGSNTNLFQVKLGLVFRLDKCDCVCNEHHTETETHYSVSPNFGGQRNTIMPNSRPGF